MVGGWVRNPLGALALLKEAFEGAFGRVEDDATGTRRICSSILILSHYAGDVVDRVLVRLETWLVLETSV